MNPTIATIFAVDGKGVDASAPAERVCSGDVDVYGLKDEDASPKRDWGTDSSSGLVSATTHAPPLEQRLDSHFLTDHCNAVPLLGQAWDASGDQKSIARGFDDFRFSIGAFEMVNVPQRLST